MQLALLTSSRLARIQDWSVNSDFVNVTQNKGRVWSNEIAPECHNKWKLYYQRNYKLMRDSTG